MTNNFSEQIEQIKAQKIPKGYIGVRIFESALDNYQDRQAFYGRSQALFERSEANAIFRDLKGLIDNPLDDQATPEKTLQTILDQHGKTLSRGIEIYEMHSIVDGILYLAWRGIAAKEISELLDEVFLEKSEELKTDKGLTLDTEHWEYVSAVCEKLKLRYHARL